MLQFVNVEKQQTSAERIKSHFVERSPKKAKYFFLLCTSIAFLKKS